MMLMAGFAGRVHFSLWSRNAASSTVPRPAVAVRPQTSSMPVIFFGLPFCDQRAGAGEHVDDVVDLLGALGRVVEIVPHHIDLAGDHRRQQAGPAAELELERPPMHLNAARTMSASAPMTLLKSFGSRKL